MAKNLLIITNWIGMGEIDERIKEVYFPPSYSLFPTNLKYQPLLPNLRKYKMNIIIITTFIAFQITP